jgi:lipopolysaccharide biosynthesis protein
MFADPSIGMVFPDDPNAVRWDKNRPHAEKLASRLGLDQLPEHFLFPVGSMFWGRVEALRPLFELDLQWADYPTEPLPYDGSVLHAIERLFGICAGSAPFHLAATHVPGFSR